MPLARAERIGGTYLTLNQKQSFFSSISFGIDALKNFIIKDDRKVIEKSYLEPSK